MHRGQEGDERVDLRGREVLAVGRHVATTLNYLANDLVAGEPCGGVVKRGTTHPAQVTERVAVAALFALNEQRALKFQGSPALDVSDRRRRGAPCVHHGRPWRERPEPGESSDDRDGENNDYDRDRTPAPTFLAGSRDERKGEEEPDDGDRTSEHQKGFGPRRQQCEQRE